jgi:hypothetical protein
MEVLQLTEAQLVTGRKEWQLPKQEKQSYMICLTQAVLPWDAARSWCHHSRGMMHHKLTAGTKSFKQQRQCSWHHPWSRIIEGVHKMGSSKPHSWTQNRQKSHFFKVVGTFWSWGGGLITWIVTADESLRLMTMWFVQWELCYVSRTRYGTNKA